MMREERVELRVSKEEKKIMNDQDACWKDWGDLECLL